MATTNLHPSGGEALQAAVAPTAKPTLTREQFELRLVNIETLWQVAFESAKTMDVYGSSARDKAKQHRMNTMVDMAITQLMEETNITVEYAQENRTGEIPFPPKVDHVHSMLNFDNNR